MKYRIFSMALISFFIITASCQTDFTSISEQEILLCEITSISSSKLISGDTTQFPPKPDFIPAHYDIYYDRENQTLKLLNASIDLTKDIKLLLLENATSNTHEMLFCVKNIFVTETTENRNLSNDLEILNILPDHSIDVKLKVDEAIKNIKINNEILSHQSFEKRLIQINGDTARIEIHTKTTIRNNDSIKKSNIIQN
ncbi:MAG: hypothetical protein JXR46_01005 [Calditrichaceae bacterium]|nr:hypothetical protein [Calditrichaceae bacterium]MBN2707594.1 hypothetical protein [Calditrichaceae bacterium]RQV93227.1 MAG: hypothetical protein EH224_13130 [Calditrichota bacterium]